MEGLGPRLTDLIILWEELMNNKFDSQRRCGRRGMPFTPGVSGDLEHYEINTRIQFI